MPTSLYCPPNHQGREIRLLTIEKSWPHREDSKLAFLWWALKETVSMALDHFFPLFYRPRSAVKGNMFTFPLDEAPAYHALSYSWGDPNDTQNIEIDDRQVAVTRNLLSALRRLRRIHDWEFIWIDAICINQADADEKNHQLPLMVDIYKNAELVFIWLGEEPALTSRIMSLITQTHEEAFIQPDRNPDDIEAQFSVMMPQLEPLRQRLRLGRNVKSLQKFFNLPYWSRVWVLQEVAYADRAVILWRRHAINFDQFLGVYYSWYLLGYYSQIIHHEDLWGGESSDQFEAFFKAVLAPKRGTSIDKALQQRLPGDQTMHSVMFGSGLLDMFFKLVSFKASDPRDKFYAILNLLPPESVLIQPDYRRTEAQLYRDVIIAELTKSKNLTCISSGGLGVRRRNKDSALQDLPSWTADFQAFWNGDSPLNLPIYVTIPGLERFRAAGDEASVYSFSSNDSLLTTFGFVCDEVRTAVCTVKRNDHRYLEPILKAAKESRSAPPYSELSLYESLFRSLWMQTRIGNEYTSGEFPFSGQTLQVKTEARSGFMFLVGATNWSIFFREEKARIFCQDRTLNARERGNRVAESVLANGDPSLSYFVICFAKSEPAWAFIRPDLTEQLFHQALRGFAAAEDDGEVLHYPDTDMPSNLPQTWIRRWNEEFFPHASLRPFVITNRGYMGLARPGTQEGDLVSIIHGCEVPLIIRPDEDNMFIIVGDSYLHGMMDGEMVQLQKEGHFTTQHFTFK